MSASNGGRGGATRLSEVLQQREETLAVAESVTGGLLCARITAVPGASAYFDRGVILYAYDSNRDLLGVTRETLDANGAVSKEVAGELAQRVRDMANTTWGLSVTGIAGPSGGSEDKPVGTTFVGVAFAGRWGSNESFVTTERFDNSGDRTQIRDLMVQNAIEVLLEELTA